MPLSENELLARDAKRNIGEELLAAIRDVKAGNIGATYTAATLPSVNIDKKDAEIQAKNANLHRGIAYEC
ncbi:MAG: hypothetical protein ACKN9T_11970 [Candidatus Methylumidiphilus sp.]